MTIGKDAVDEAVRLLREAQATRTPCAPLRERLLPLGDVASAYAVQRAMTQEAVAQGRRIVGAKIGLTNPAVQRQLGVDQPDFGVLFADMAAFDGAEVDITRILQPKVEAEVAFVLGRDLPHEQVTVADVIRATDHLLPAIEIVGSRVANWDITIVDTVADNASAGMFVLGNRPVSLADVDLRLCGMVMEHEGEPVSVGAGASCLGNPVHAVAWLAETMAQAGTPLRAGDVILSGALGPVVPATPGSAYEARISGLGTVRTRFSTPTVS